MKLVIDLNILAEFLAKALGKDTEVAIHNLEDMSKSLHIIKNAHVTGRRKGLGLTDLASSMINNEIQLDDNPYKINYESRAIDGRALRSSTLIIRDENQKPKALLCLNHDDSEIKNIIKHLDKKIHIEDQQTNEDFSTNIKKIGEKIIADIMAENQKPVDDMIPQDKIDLVSKMLQAGAFEVKGAVEITAKMLNVSEPTLYRYLKQAEWLNNKS